ncbi:hypothetical protein BCT30_07260 [Enterovibrio norvegicus]|uniref:hypothetical protein n=1 Tax=Enterovibrio norvegicus TaxID=188144 RepID=UPI000C859C66|nr:hypothetical protein [Enterovibrio norvegicus]MCC4797138.1 hypothetical protein [Enterovibrio norvegicus]PMI35275.1 hypothetical protein BCU46_18490 [Enterovibrio norvegicus]PMN56250.1 hypothetical protein BCT30_07260 [Enterovibrio norvegicus]TKF09845.1 hypothetical protein FCV66_20970 [Enterovibrio norvegicus]TKF35255.1 hypothetical protein FCV83_06015 [Enterovibrio norvegicus]
MKIRNLAILATVFSILPFSTLADDAANVAELTAQERVEEIKAVMNDVDTDVDKMAKEAEVQTEQAIKEAKDDADSAVGDTKTETNEMKHAAEAKVDDVIDSTNSQ